MSEAWAIYLVGALLAWIGFELRGIKAELKTFVREETCNRQMDTHCKKIDALEKDVRKNENEITIIKTKIEDGKHEQEIR